MTQYLADVYFMPF